MQNAVEQVVKDIPLNRFFDSHFVISQIKKYHWEVYNSFIGPVENVGAMHGQIAQLIQRLPSLVRDCEAKGWSQDIHGFARECALWQRLG